MTSTNLVSDQAQGQIYARPETVTVLYYYLSTVLNLGTIYNTILNKFFGSYVQDVIFFSPELYGIGSQILRRSLNHCNWCTFVFICFLIIFFITALLFLSKINNKDQELIICLCILFIISWMRKQETGFSPRYIKWHLFNQYKTETTKFSSNGFCSSFLSWLLKGTFRTYKRHKSIVCCFSFN